MKYFINLEIKLNESIVSISTRIIYWKLMKIF